MNSRKNALLPSGFEDLLSPESETEFFAISKLMKTFSQFGYTRVKPPLAEFEETMLGDGPGSALAQETFRVMDPLSHRMMALRSDITAQIARIAQSRLFDEPRPLRIAYANDVIRTRASQQRTLRQFCQAGCEMIGADTEDSDIEIAVVALSGLAALGVQNASMDFALPRLMDMIFESHALPHSEQESVRAALKGREDGALLNLKDKKLSALLRDLLQISGPADTALKKLKALNLPKEAKNAVQRLETVIAGTQKAADEWGIKNIRLTLDPLETKGFDYHNGVTFTMFSKNTRGELGRGGRYTIYNSERDSGSAAGFTFYMDSLRPVMQSAPSKRYIHVAASESWALVQTLQIEGWCVVRGSDKKQHAATCSHIYKNGKIEEIS
jgi:ATP phosphoribosyltransferase regulatory subunit